MGADLWTAAAVAAAILCVIVARIQSMQRAGRWNARIERRIGELERKIVEAKEECDRRARESCARINVLERRVTACEAPDPIDLMTMDEED